MSITRQIKRSMERDNNKNLKRRNKCRKCKGKCFTRLVMGGYVQNADGGRRECETVRLKHKLIATAKAIPTIVTLRHYYRCDDCGKLHRFTGHEFPAYGGLWEKYVFVSEECAENTIRKAH